MSIFGKPCFNATHIVPSSLEALVGIELQNFSTLSTLPQVLLLGCVCRQTKQGWKRGTRVKGCFLDRWLDERGPTLFGRNSISWTPGGLSRLSAYTHKVTRIRYDDAGHQIDSDCEILIRCTVGTYLWCRISVTIMYFKCYGTWAGID